MATRVVALLMLTMIDSGESKGNRSSHRHFKAVTAMSLLQYQKQTRLLKARLLLIAHGRSVAAAAHEVGYESPTHFSREYARLFSRPLQKIQRKSYRQ
jgi:AraC-like DNA-binding protein